MGGRSAVAVIRHCRVLGRAEHSPGRWIRHRGLCLGYGDDQFSRGRTATDVRKPPIPVGGFRRCEALGSEGTLLKITRLLFSHVMFVHGRPTKADTGVKFIRRSLDSAAWLAVSAHPCWPMDPDLSARSARR
jgi:hypothetical protein